MDSKTLGVLSCETVVPLRPDEIDNAEIVYNKCKIQIVSMESDWKPLPPIESPDVQLAKICARILATLQRGIE